MMTEVTHHGTHRVSGVVDMLADEVHAARDLYEERRFDRVLALEKVWKKVFVIDRKCKNRE